MKFEKAKTLVPKMIKKKQITVPIVAKMRGRYKYNIHLLRWANRMVKKRESYHRVKFGKIEDVNTFKESELLQQHQDSPATEKKANFLHPFLMVDVSVPKYSIPSELEITLQKGTRVDYTSKNLFYRVPTKNVMKQIGKNKNRRINFSVPQMELSQQNYRVPKIVQKFLGPIHKVNYWLYCGNRQTQWHYDGHDNFLYVLSGKKIVYLSQPDVLSSNNAFSIYSNHLETNIYRKIVKVQRAIVTKGSCVYIPKGWWHKVYSFGDPNSAINFWGNSVNLVLEKLSKTEKSLIFKGLLFQLTNKYCKQRFPFWEQLSEQRRQQVREYAGERLIRDVDWQWEQKKQQGDS